MQTLNIGLVGTGFMGKGHAMAYRMMPMVFNPPPALPRLLLLGDVTAELAERGARDFGFDEWVVGWEGIVNHPAVDVVDITAPNHLHKEIALAAVAVGKHVYCEKPLALTAAEAREMRDAAERAGVKTLVGFNYLKNPAALAAQRLIANGDLGDIYQFHGVFHQDALADPEQPFSWRFEQAKAGAGALGDLGAHVLAMADLLAGDVARVCGLTRTVIPERPEASGAYGYGAAAAHDAPRRRVENEDICHVLLDFAEFGA
jgi:predicted dehydrogenase